MRKTMKSLFLTIAILSVATMSFATGVPPTTYPGNFVASDDDQVCYDMSALGYIGEVTSEMRGFKLDPPVAFEDSFVQTTITADGKYLSWTSSNGATVLAFIIKGGPNYNVYNYVGSGLTTDSGLHSPLHKKNIPAISHYNFCYLLPPPAGEQGCTPGYWKNHTDRWFGPTPSQDFDTAFGVDLFSPDITLVTASDMNGGGVNALARHATAALLNAWGGVPNADGTTVDYPYDVDDVIAMVQEAAAGDSIKIEEIKDLLAEANELGCPLEGTKAKK